MQNTKNKNGQGENNAPDFDKEIEIYLNEPTEPLEVNPLKYWKNNNTFPTLSKMASTYLSIPAGSVFSEQVFSEAGNIVRPNRTLLTSQHVQQLIFLKKNFVLLQSDM